MNQTFVPIAQNRPVIKRRNWVDAYRESNPLAESPESSRDAESEIRIPVVTTESFFQSGYAIEHLQMVSARRIGGAKLATLGVDAIVDVVISWDGGSDRVFQELETQVLRDLRMNAANLGADVIVGLRLQFSEVEWSHAVFLLCFAQGTAAKLVRQR